MTGGQPTDGQITAPRITQQMAAEGVQKIVIVTDEPEKYDATSELVQTAVNAHGATGDAWKLAPGVTVHHRDELERIQRELREYPGVSVLIYDQTCASEKRRRRKKNTPEKTAFPDPARRVVINDLVCEGCGDCSVKSNCLSVEPLDTEFGRKRQINQSSCNKDYSCLKGFCPSFVTVEGGKLRKGKAAAGTMPDLPQPERGVAARARLVRHRDHRSRRHGRGDDRAAARHGRAPRGQGRFGARHGGSRAEGRGRVLARADRADASKTLFATRIAMGEADVLLGCDLIVTSSNEALSKVHTNRTRALVEHVGVADRGFRAQPQLAVRQSEPRAAGARCGRRQRVRLRRCQRARDRIDGRRDLHQPLHARLRVAEGLAAAVVRGNGACDRDQRSRRREQPQGVRVGSLAADDLDAVQRTAFPDNVVELKRFSSSLEELVARRVEFLTGYQNAKYAQRYSDLVERVRKVESDRLQSSKLAEAVARNYFRLLAYKDEYEVARLHSDPAFRAKIAAQFEGDYTLNFYLAPPLLAEDRSRTPAIRRRSATGRG